MLENEINFVRTRMSCNGFETLMSLVSHRCFHSSVACVSDDVKELVQKIGPEFEKIFDTNDPKTKKVVEQKKRKTNLINWLMGRLVVKKSG